MSDVTSDLGQSGAEIRFIPGSLTGMQTEGVLKFAVNNKNFSQVAIMLHWSL